jgi:hypothetical protein
VTTLPLKLLHSMPDGSYSCVAKQESVLQEEGAAEEEDADDEFDMEDDDYYQGENYGALTTVCVNRGSTNSATNTLYLSDLAFPLPCS